MTEDLEFQSSRKAMICCVLLIIVASYSVLLCAVARAIGWFQP